MKAAHKGDKNAFAVSIIRSTGTIAAKSFVKHIGWSARAREAFPATWNEKEKMLEITLPGVYTKSN